MKLRELSTRSGIASTTIKWYLREGLMPRGSATASNQAEYSEKHLSRVRFVRSMMELGGLSSVDAKRLVSAIDDTRIPLGGLVALAAQALPLSPGVAITEEMRELSAAFMGKLGWVWNGDHVAEDTLGAVLALSAEQSRDAAGAFPEFDERASREAKWLHYAAAVGELVEEEIDGFESLGSDRESAVQRVIIGNRLSELALLALHRLAQRERWLALASRASAI